VYLSCIHLPKVYLLIEIRLVIQTHPYVIAIVFSFKAAIMFEHDRRENDARVSSVFLAQTDMMRVLLE